VIYICIPALNEARTVGVLLWKIRQVMEEFPRDYHILVLDDGSTDDTNEVLEPYVRLLPVTVLRNERTQGYPAALERLIREAARLSTHPKRDVVVTIQADFTESPDDIPHLLKRIEGGADVVGSSITSTEGELPRSLRWSRRGLPWLLSRARLPKEIKDPLSGFRAYRVSILKRALQDRDGKPLLTKHGWAANAELLLSVTPHVRRAEDAEVRLRYTRRERATRFRPWATAVELWDLARKGPRRMALARAALAAAPPEAPDAPSPPQPERTPERGPRHERGPRSEREHRPERGPRPEREPRHERGPRPERGAQAEQQPRPERGPKPERPPRPRREERPAAAAVESTEPVVMADAVPGVEGDAAQPAPAKRRRPPRRRGKRGAGQAAADAQGSADAEGAAEGGEAGDAAPAPSVPAATQAEGSAGMPEGASEGASAEGGEAQAPARKRSRPRRPRRPRADRAAAGEGGAEGGEGSGGVTDIPQGGPNEPSGLE